MFKLSINKVLAMSELITLNLCAQESAAYIMLLLQHYPQKKQFYPFDVYAITIPATEQDKATELRMQLSHILLAFDKPTAGARDDNLKPAARYYAVVKNQFLGSGSFGSVRPVRGTWKIEDGQALFKVKSDIYKQRVLKTLFFTAEPFNPQHTPAASYEETKRKNEQRDALTQEQIIASYTPHLSTKYPIIETDEGVHLLMRRQPGVDLFAMISSLQGNPQQISVIQRLLLCLELYETLEQEVHSVTTANNGKLIHRDIKPQNIMLYQQGYLFKPHVVDYGMCTSSDSTQSPGSFGSPLYMDPVVYNDRTSSPVPSAANDLFAVAIICAQIWGDTRRQTMTSTYLAQENSNIQFSNLFTNIVCSDKLQQALKTLFSLTTKYSVSERLNREETMRVYKQLLLREYSKITTKSPVLAQRLDELNRQLKDADYLALDYAARMKFDKEYLAADFLMDIPDAVTQHNRKHSLYDIWNSYSQEQLKNISTASIHQDAPIMLAKRMTDLKKYCEQLYVSPTAETLIPLIKSWTIISGLSNLFSRVIELTPTHINSVKDIFNTILKNPLIDDQAAAINNSIYQHLENHLNYSQPKNAQCIKRIRNLCLDAVEQKTLPDSELISEWFSAIRLLNLNTLLSKLCLTNADELTKALDPKHSFSQAFESLYAYYKQRIIEQILPKKPNKPPLNTSTKFFEPNKCVLPTHLINQIDSIFQQNMYNPEIIPQKILYVVRNRCYSQQSLIISNLQDMIIQQHSHCGPDL